jgi:hypothetical protein
MLPNIASPLASAAPGAALPLPTDLAAAAPDRAVARARVASAAKQTADAFAPSGKTASATPAAASTRAPTAAVGYAPASTAAKTAARTTTTAKAASTAKKTTTAAAASSTTAASKALAFLDDKNLSVEEKLMRLLSYLNAKWDKDLEKKLKEFETGQRTTTTQSAPKKKSGGLLGSLGSVVKAATSFFPAVGVAVEALKNPAVRSVVSKIGGPVLAAAATALGYPALAPVLLRYGPALVDAAAGIATSIDAPSGSAPSSGASAGTGSSPSETGMNDREMQLKLMEIQRIRDLQKEMFSMVSHILRSGHETRMNVIQNIR